MGNSCPKCSSSIDHDFGVFVCTKCGAVLFVDFDGNVQLSTPETGGSPTFEAKEIEQISEIQEIQEIEIIPEEIIEKAAEELVADLALEPAPEFVANNDWADQSVEDSMAAANPPPPAPSFADRPVTDVNFDDVVEYANQTELDNSPLVYTLWIEGIDRKETREKVIEVLKDIKFNLHLKEIIPTIKGGVLELRDLNPVKTSLIATRLREESVRFRWKQNVFQSEAASGT